MSRPASNPGDLPLIDGLFSGRLKRPPVGELLGTEYVAYDVAAGTAHLRFTALPSFINPGGTVHGGMLAAMLDELMAVSMSVAMREGEYNITLDLGTRFLKAAELGPIDGFGKLIKRGRAVGFVEGELRNAKGDVLARGHATMQIQSGFPKRTPGGRLTKPLRTVRS